MFIAITLAELTGSLSKIKPLKSIGSRALRKKKNTRKAHPIKTLHKAGDYKMHFFTITLSWVKMNPLKLRQRS